MLKGADGQVEAVARVQVALRAALDDVEELCGGVEGERGVPVERGVDGALGITDVTRVDAPGGQAGATLGRGVRLGHGLLLSVVSVGCGDDAVSGAFDLLDGAPAAQ